MFQKDVSKIMFIIYFLLFFLLYNIVSVLPYINMYPPRVYTCSPSQTPLPPPSPFKESSEVSINIPIGGGVNLLGRRDSKFKGCEETENSWGDWKRVRRSSEAGVTGDVKKRQGAQVTGETGHVEPCRPKKTLELYSE